MNDTLITVVEVEDANERLSTASQNEDINERLKMAALDGDIEKLYGLLAVEPNILDRSDQSSFCETPLHVAARQGKTHFAMELMTLKPSLAWKLNKSGFSAIHLALQNNYSRMVKGFMEINKELISIKGRGRITPLHYVAQTGNTELLSEFLFVSPSSIEDLTIKCETAMHITVKNQKLEAFKVLLGWLKRVNREDILNWKDEDGNTVFHIATSTNQIEVMKLLRKIVNVNAKNLDGQTAKDIYRSNRTSLSPEVSKILSSAKAKAAQKLSTSATPLADYLSQGLSLIETRNKLLGLNNLSDKNLGSSQNITDLRSSILVVAILIATATYQAGISPPGGYWQEDSNPHSNNGDQYHFAGQMILDPSVLVFFFGFNGIAFFSSILVIMILIIGLPMWKVIYCSTVALGFANFVSFGAVFPTSSCGTACLVARSVLLLAYPLLTLLIVVVLLFAFLRNERRHRRVDFSAGYFSSSRSLAW